MAKPSNTYCKTVDEFEARYVRPKAGKVLVVGSRVYATRADRRKKYQDVIGIDVLDGEGVDLVLNLEDALPFYLGPFSHIDCISVLEHSRRPWLLAANIQHLLKNDCTVYVQVPFIWRLHSYPNDYWRFSLDGVRELFPSIEWIELQYVHGSAKERIPDLWDKNLLYFARTEVCGFGKKK